MCGINLIFNLLVCLMIEQFYLKSIQNEGIAFCFDSRKNSKVSNFFCNFDRAVVIFLLM